ncbi:MAG: sigma-70 family RNA polymerase sigma factor [Armatimonadetes bacterium]|nr:sigma-70 family RNA polymerase sigma factor [Armatimonadota bacterium]
MHSQAARDDRALVLQFEAQRTWMLRNAYRKLRNWDEAQDAVQEALIKAVRHADRLDPERSLRPWLSRVLATTIVDIVRRREVAEYGLEDDSREVRTEAGAPRELDNLEVSEVVEEAMNKLPRSYRQILQMRYLGDMGVEEIAVAMKRPTGTIKSWLFRAREMLRNDLSIRSLDVAC